MSGCAVGAVRQVLALAVRYAHIRQVAALSGGPEASVPVCEPTAATTRRCSTGSPPPTPPPCSTRAAVAAPGDETRAALTKAWWTWQGRQVIIEARERCGAHGLFDANGIAPTTDRLRGADHGRGGQPRDHGEGRRGAPAERGGPRSRPRPPAKRPRRRRTTVAGPRPDGAAGQGAARAARPVEPHLHGRAPPCRRHDRAAGRAGNCWPPPAGRTTPCCTPSTGSSRSGCSPPKRGPARRRATSRRPRSRRLPALRDETRAETRPTRSPWSTRS